MKTALDSSHATELSRSIESAKKETRNLSKATEKQLKDDNEKLNQQIQTLNRDIEALRSQMTQAINDAVKEGDKKAFEERKKAAAHSEHHQEEMDKVKVCNTQGRPTAFIIILGVHPQLILCLGLMYL